MARIQLIEIAHAYDTAAIHAVGLKPLDDELGRWRCLRAARAFGCGKTTLLNIISGLYDPSQGTVLFDDLEVTALPPEARNIAQVFQFPIVYETMTVFENLAFPLRNRRWWAAEIRKRVHEIAEILELGADLGRRARDCRRRSSSGSRSAADSSGQTSPRCCSTNRSP